MPGYPPEPVLGKRKRAEPKHYDPAQAPQRGRRRSTEQAEQRKSAQVSGAVSGAATAATDATAATAAKTATVVATTGTKRNRSHDNRRRRRPGRKDKAFDPSKRRRGSWLDTPTKAKILTRYSLCLERRQAGLPVKETAADIAREFGVDGAVPRRLWVKNQQGKDLRTQRAAAGRPLEFGADAEAALIEQLRDNRKGKHKRSSAENKLAHDLAEKGLVNPKTNKPYGHATIGRARKRLKFRPRRRLHRPMLSPLQMRLRLAWARKNRNRRWLACKDGGKARVWIDEWWAKCDQNHKFALYRRDDSDSDDEYDCVPAHCNKIMSLTAVSRDAPDGK